MFTFHDMPCSKPTPEFFDFFSLFSLTSLSQSQYNVRGSQHLKSWWFPQHKGKGSRKCRITKSKTNCYSFSFSYFMGFVNFNIIFPLLTNFYSEVWKNKRKNWVENKRDEKEGQEKGKGRRRWKMSKENRMKKKIKIKKTSRRTRVINGWKECWHILNML